MDFFYYDWVEQNLDDVNFPNLEIGYRTDSRPRRTKIEIKKSDVTITIHIHWTTGVITVMGSDYANWCLNDFIFLREQTDKLGDMSPGLPEMGGTGSTLGSLEISHSREIEVETCLNDNLNKSRSGDCEIDEREGMSYSEEVNEVHDIEEGGRMEGQSIWEEMENVKINGIVKMLKEIMAGQRRLEERIGQVEVGMRDIRDKIEGKNAQKSETRKDEGEQKRGENRIGLPANELLTEDSIESITKSTVNERNGSRANGRIILEGGSRMKNVKNKMSKIEDKDVWVYAKGGSNLKGVLDRLKSNLSEGDKDSVVVIQGGVNDLYQGDSVGTVCDNMAELIKYLKGRVRAVIVSSIIPTTNPGRKHDPKFHYNLRRLNYELLNTVKENGGHYLDLIDSFETSGCLINKFYRADQLHLNDKGNELFSSILKNWISNFLGEPWDEDARYKGSRMAYPKGERKIKKIK